MSCPQCETELENFSRQEGGWCPLCKVWFPFDIILDSMEEECEDNDPFWGNEEDLDFDGECEGTGNDIRCLCCRHWGGEGLCCLSLFQDETKEIEK